MKTPRVSVALLACVALLGSLSAADDLAWPVLTKENIEDRGRMLGEVLLAVAEARDLLSSER